jgi:UDP-glucose 4-epimerase
MEGVDTVLHTATLHKPHVVSHPREAFVATNVLGTLILLEEARRVGVKSFVLTSTTSAFGDALKPPPGEPAAWIDESVVPAPKNIYGVTKTAAEDLCRLFHRNEGFACVVLRTSRFFPEEDDDPQTREAFADANVKANEFLFRRVAIEDVVAAHLIAAERAPAIGFGRYIVSATTPFKREDLARLRADASAVVRERARGWEEEYARRGWRMFPTIDRVYDNALSRRELGWRPAWDFESVIGRLRETGDIRGPLAKVIGEKGYHAGRRYAAGDALAERR